jgi:hypothetical protein
MRSFSRFRSPFWFFLLLAGSCGGAPASFVQQAENPFDNNQDGLPDLGMAKESNDSEKH